MEAQVPAVVAVVVTTGSSPWLGETLTSLSTQGYQDLSVLVLVAGGGPDPTALVGSILPDAYVRILPDRPGFAAAANHALTMVEGATFFLLCHDDCALDRDAVHNMVEEAFRSNAGVVSPKYVHWDDPSILLRVGMQCDKTGAVVDRVQDGEVDHGQHDAVRDVFVAPGGCTLIRADLWRELDGFDPAMVAMGEDLDLSWRSQVAGSRVVVAPSARVRHREALASGASALEVDGLEPDGGRPVTLQALQRRHELRAVLKCYTRFHLLRVLPQAVVLALGEVLVALLARDPQRARAVVGAWTWNARHRRDLRAPRRRLAAVRIFPDAEVRRLQLRGSARLSRYISRLTSQGLDAANAVARGVRRERPTTPVLTGSVGSSFSEDADFDELDDLGHRSGRDRFGRPVRRSFLGTGRQRVAAAVVGALVIVIGTRELFFGALPVLGQLPPLPGWSADWHHFLSGWQSSGVGTTAPASPAFGIAGIAGTVLLGAMGLTQKVLLLGCIPVGAVGMGRFMRPLGSARARVVAALCYLGLPLPYAALGAGRWDGLVAFAVMPFVVARLARAAGMAPFDEVVGRGWRGTARGQIAALGAILAVGTAFAPAILPATLVCAACLIVGGAVVGDAARARQLGLVTLQSVAVALVLCAPWVVGTLLAGRQSVAVFGLPISPAAAPGWGELIRFAIGPAVRSPIVWALVGASALPLLIGRALRLVWAARLWSMALPSWVLAYGSAHHWMGAFAPSVSVMVAPAAVAVAAGIGLGIASFETDLTGLSFGWRQLASGVALAATTLGVLPVVAGAAGGRWGLASNGVEQPLSFLAPPASSHGGTAGTAAAGSDSRVLWLGDPRTLPVGGFTVEPGLAYALTSEALPTTAQVWTPAGAGPADLVRRAITLAIDGDTVHLGQLLAPEGVQTIVVVDGIDPGTTLAGSVQAPPPPGIANTLLNQDDLRADLGASGVDVFNNTVAMPVVGQRARALPETATTPAALAVTRWRPALRAPHPTHLAAGTLRAATTVYAGVAPAGSFVLSSGGRPAARRPAFGWASQYRVTRTGRASLALQRFPYVTLAVLVELLAWLVLALALLGDRRLFRRPAPGAQ